MVPTGAVHEALGLDRPDLSVVEVWRERQDSPLNDCQQTAQRPNAGQRSRPRHFVMPTTAAKTAAGRDAFTLGRDHLGSSRHARIGPKEWPTLIAKRATIVLDGREIQPAYLLSQ